jgi:DNA adenine methylase
MEKAKPFIKWAGGKSQLLPALSIHFPPREKIVRYFEPFLGGAAVFFHLGHARSFLSDSNRDLVELYQVVRQDVEDLIEALRHHINEREYFYNIRSQDPATLTPVQRAARLIYLNKTCFNGLYRVNSRGQFNVPFGRHKNPTICDADGLRAASTALQSADITLGDFETVSECAGRGDFVYFDPPYHPLNKSSSFTSYTAGRFDEVEQRRLAHTFRQLTDRGCFVVMSNSDTPLIRELYADFCMHEIQANRAINSKPGGRGKITELLIVNSDQIPPLE